MTPERLANLIPIALAKIFPPKIAISSDSPISLCGWLDDYTSSKREIGNEFPLGSLWPQPPRIAANHYSLSQAPELPTLWTRDCGPVQFCNRPGVNPAGDVVPSLAQCQRVCDHVIAHTGEVVFSRTDFALPGPIPFAWQRHYRRGRDDNSGLGPGWHHTLSERLQIVDMASDNSKGNIAELQTAEGRRITFTVPAIGHSCYNRFERLLLYRQSLHSYRVSGFDQADRIFRADGISGALPLMEIRDKCGNSLTVDYQEGLPQKISTSWGLTLDFCYSGKHLEKIANRDAPSDEQVLCSYEYDTSAQCLSVASHRITRENYRYDDQRIIAIDHNQLGEIEFSYDHRQRCRFIRRNQLTCILSWRDAQRRCTLKVPDRHATHWRFSEFGQLILEEQCGRWTRYFHDHYGNLCQKTSAGSTDIYRHDEFGRLVRHTSNGISDRFIYDRCGLLTGAQLCGEQNWKFRYGTLALPVQVTDPEGHHWQLRYNERGQLVQLIDPEHGEVNFHWNSSGQLTAVQRGGRHWEFTYDHWQRLTIWSRTGQIEKQWHYGSDGALLKCQLGEYVFQLDRDSAGRACGITQDGQSNLAWQYDKNGNIGRLYLPDGQELEFQWDAHGWITQATAAKHRLVWHYDAFGQLGKYTDGHGDRILWQYDDSGRVREYRDNDTHWFFLYTESGALRQIRNNSGQQCEFQFDTCGRLVQAENAHSRVCFQYDRRNLLIAEHHDSADNECLSINHQYDGRGWLKGSTSENLDLGYLQSPDAALYGIDANGEAVLRCEYSGVEEYWIQGRTRSCLRYSQGQLSEIETAQKLHWQFASSLALTDFELTSATADCSHATERDMRGNIVREQRVGQPHGEYRYQYDGWGLLTSAECGDFKTFFRYDPFGRRLSKLSTHRKSTCQRRVDFHWHYAGLWCEHSLVGDKRQPANYYLYHPIEGTLLSSWQPDRREHYLVDPAGAPLAVFDDLGELLWTGNTALSEDSAHEARGTTWRRTGEMFDSETGLYYGWRGYWHPHLNRWLHKENPLFGGRYRRASSTENVETSAATELA